MHAIRFRSGDTAPRPLRRPAVAAAVAWAALQLLALPAAADGPLSATAPAIDLDIGGEGTATVPSPGGSLPTLPDLESRGATVGSVAVMVGDVFDEQDPEENRALYRLANRLHINTREDTIREQLLFRPGEPLSADLVQETARLLRTRGYLDDADVIPTAWDADSNTVDLAVRVRDVWTLEPSVGVGRSGGTSSSRARIAEENLFGFGQKIALSFESDTDRTSAGLEFHDPNLFGSWWRLDTDYSSNSDGNDGMFSIGRPFYALDTPWNAMMNLRSADRIVPLYDLGKKVSQFEGSYERFGLQGGTSSGRSNGWVRRWLAGYTYDRATFDSAPEDDVPSLVVPEDRQFSYPWIGFELIEDAYETRTNRDQIGRREDVFLGKRVRGTLGFASTAFGSDRSAGMLGLEAESGWGLGEKDTVQLAGSWSSRLEGGSTANSLVDVSARYHHQFNEKNVFYAALSGAHGQALDVDNPLQLGGDNGLRGYPLRYQSGTTRALATVEERYYTDWYPFHLVRVGGAVFADVGRTWGESPLASEPAGTLGDVGFGLRLGNAHSGAIGNVLHIDLAFPLAGRGDISGVQLLLEGHKSF